MVKPTHALSNTFNMLTKLSSLSATLKNNTFQVYLICGNDQFLMKEAQQEIKKKLLRQFDCESTSIQINHPNEWNDLKDQASSLSLFSEHSIFHVSFEKKTFDKNGHHFIEQIINTNNTHCSIIINAPNLQIKSLQQYTNHKNFLITQVFALSDSALVSWIKQKLNTNQLSFESDVPHMIQQHSQGNMLAAAQAVDKLALSFEHDETITADVVKTHLIDQSQHGIFELVDSLLLGENDKSILLIQHAKNTRVEPTLLMWLFTKEVRLLISIFHEMKAQSSFGATCKKLKIWNNKTALYQSAYQRFEQKTLYGYLQSANQIDQLIKSNLSTNTLWLYIENLLIAFINGIPAKDLK